MVWLLWCFAFCIITRRLLQPLIRTDASDIDPLTVPVVTCAAWITQMACWILLDKRHEQITHRGSVQGDRASGSGNWNHVRTMCSFTEEDVQKVAARCSGSQHFVVCNS